ncbi:MAG: nucleotide exchange factor GrpE [Magnetococcus sp. DMHC-1]
MNGNNDAASESRQEPLPDSPAPADELSSGKEDEVVADQVDESVPGVDPEEQIQVLEAKVEEWRQAYLRSLADMDNLRKRTSRDIEASRKYALEAFAKDLLLVADNLDRALSALETSQTSSETPESNMKSLLDGVTLVRTELQRILKKNGVTRIESLQQPFDPNQHQAMIQVSQEGVPPGTVVQEFQAGYLLSQRLLRPALVAVTQ